MSANSRAPFLLLCAAFCLLAGCQSRFVYFPYRSHIATPASMGLAYEPVYLTTKDGETIHGWWIPAKTEWGVLLFLHGNGGNISHRLDSIAIFHQMGLSVFIIDYRGYGLSTGEPSEGGTYNDADAAWDYLTSARGIPPERIVIFGRSLGGSIAAWLASKHTPRVLIVESSFSTIRELANDHYPDFIVSLFLTYRYDTIEYLSNVTCPVLVIHSPDDRLIRIKHGKAIFNSIKTEKKMILIRGSHNTGFLESQPEYGRAIDMFLQQYLG